MNSYLDFSLNQTPYIDDIIGGIKSESNLDSAISLKKPVMHLDSLISHMPDQKTVPVVSEALKMSDEQMDLSSSSNNDNENQPNNNSNITTIFIIVLIVVIILIFIGILIYWIINKRKTDKINKLNDNISLLQSNIKSQYNSKNTQILSYDEDSD